MRVNRLYFLCLLGTLSLIQNILIAESDIGSGGQKTSNLYQEDSLRKAEALSSRNDNSSKNEQQAYNRDRDFPSIGEITVHNYYHGSQKKPETETTIKSIPTERVPSNQENSTPQVNKMVEQESKKELPKPSPQVGKGNSNNSGVGVGSIPSQINSGSNRGMDMNVQNQAAKERVDNDNGKILKKEAFKNEEVAKKKGDGWQRFWDFLSIGRDGRHKFGIGLGVSGAFFANYSFLNEDPIEIHNGVFFHFYAKFNLIDTKYFFLSIGMTYNDEHVGQLARGARMDMVFHYPPPFCEQVVLYLSSAMMFRLDIGVNLGRFFTLYSILGVSGLYFQQGQRLVDDDSGQMYYKGGSDYMDAFPSLGLGLETRLHDRLAIKLEFTMTFVDKKLAPVFPNHLASGLDSIYIGNLTFGLHFYL